MGVSAVPRTLRLGRPNYAPKPWLALWYFAQVFYAVMGTVLGISIPMAGIGMLMLLGAVCFVRSGQYSFTIVRALVLPFACATSFVLIQVLVHGESLRDTEAVRAFVTWMVTLFVLYYLVLHPRFFHYFALAIFLIGLSTLPYLRSFREDLSRTALDKSIAISNPNDLGAWFGFCALYFAILGLETRRNWVRALAWCIAVCCLLVVGLTGSRGPLLSASCGLLVAFRRILKRGFLPVLGLVVFAWVAYSLGLFERAEALYEKRAFVETGRFLVWPLALARFAASPLVGVGLKSIFTYVPEAEAFLTPHNGIILLALTSGVLPVAFLLGYWFQLARTVVKPPPEIVADGPLLIPLLVYSFMIMMNLNEAYKDPWMVATFAGVGRGVLANATRAEAVRRWRRMGIVPEPRVRVGVKSHSTA